MPHDHQKPTELVAVSITLPSWRTQPRALGEFDVGGIRKELIKALDSTKQIKWAVFGLDISMNDDTNKGFDVGWQLQLYGFAHVEDRLTLSKSLRQGFGHE
jgi:hypothetical protein